MTDCGGIRLTSLFILLIMRYHTPHLSCFRGYFSSPRFIQAEYFFLSQQQRLFAQFFAGQKKKIHKSITAISLNGLREMSFKNEAMKVFCLLISRISLICQQQLLSTISPIIGSFFFATSTKLAWRRWPQKKTEVEKCFSSIIFTWGLLSLTHFSISNQKFAYDFIKHEKQQQKLLLQLIKLYFAKWFHFHLKFFHLLSTSTRERKKKLEQLNLHFFIWAFFTISIHPN